MTIEYKYIHWRSIFGVAGFLCTTSVCFAQIQFQDVSSQAGMLHPLESWGSAWGDFNGDNFPDLWTGNHDKTPTLYLNNTDGTFNDIVPQVWSGNPDSDAHGSAWADFDGDGDMDLIEQTGAPNPNNPNHSNQFYINNNGTQLIESAAQWNLMFTEHRGRSALWFDYNDDAKLDLVLTGYPNSGGGLFPSSIFRQGSQSFSNVTKSVGFNCGGNSNFATLSDVSGDGVLDLICHGFTFPQKIYDISSVPFQNISNIIPTTANVFDAIAADFNNDLQADVFAVKFPTNRSNVVKRGNRKIHARLTKKNDEIGFDFTAAGNLDIDVTSGQLKLNEIFIGSSGWHPTGTTAPTNAVLTLSSSNPSAQGLKPHQPGINAGLYIGYNSNAGKWQVRLSAGSTLKSMWGLFKNSSSVSQPTIVGFNPSSQAKSPTLYLSNNGSYVNSTNQSGLNNPIFCTSVSAGDFDNDMDVDLYLVCEFAPENLPNILYENDGNGAFVAVPNAGGAAGTTIGAGKNVAVSDYDVDGFLDLYVTNGAIRGSIPNGSDQLFNNLGNNNHWVELDLVGVQSNPHGIGAQVIATASGLSQLREQGSGSHAYTQNDRRIHFGLGANTNVNIQVRWPSGIVDQFSNVAADSLYRVTEGGAIEPINLGSSSISINNVTVNESAGSAQFNVTLNPQSNDVVSANYATLDGSASSGADYMLSAGVIQFNPGQSTKPINVPIFQDTLAEGTEQFTVQLTNAINAGIVDNTGTATIIDDDFNACGEPNYSAGSDLGVFLWKDCGASGQWMMRVTGGGNPNLQNYQGNVVSDQTFNAVTGFSLEGSDVLDTTNPLRVDYSLNAKNAGQDGFNLSVVNGANSCFTATSLPSGAQVLLGGNKIPVTGPINLDTLSSCSEPTIDPCGKPNYSAGSDLGVFLWKDCGASGQWMMRVTGGGNPNLQNYQGNVVSDQTFNAVTGFSLEGSDVLDTTNPLRVDYSLNAKNSGQDGFDFDFAATANVCFDVTQHPSGAGLVTIGASQQQLSTPFELNSFNACP